MHAGVRRFDGTYVEREVEAEAKKAKENCETQSEQSKEIQVFASGWEPLHHRGGLRNAKTEEAAKTVST